jgi:AcrR family transcriptional regulator
MTESKKRGPRRSIESEQAILAATLQLLKEKPLRDISIEAIATKAGVGKMTIYKWWPSRAYVALDALSKSLNKTIPIPDTGDTTRDLEELLGSAMTFFSSKKGQIFGRFLAEAQNDPDFAVSFRERLLNPRRDAARLVLQRAIGRGEIKHALEIEAILDLLFGAMIFRLMAGHGTLNKTEAKSMISILMEGIANKTT